jgi:hypothetical protein
VNVRRLVVAATAGHLDDEPIPGRRTSATWRPWLEQRQPATGVLEICRRQPITDEATCSRVSSVRR